MITSRLPKLLILGILTIPGFAQVPVAPAVIPRITFVNADGAPCAGCSLFTYGAGTTTPLATYKDATGTSQNTNPIVLDAAGGANIWLGGNSYKFILKDASGATIWSVDSVNSGSLLPCASASAIQTANTGGNGLNCDPSITINTVNHTLNIGTMTTNHVTIGSLGTPTSWTFDTTSPATALASLGAGTVSGGTAGQIAIYSTTGNNVQGASAIPAGVTAITASPSDNSTKPATTAYVALPGAINPTSVQIASGVAVTDNQGNGAKVQHSTGTTTTNDCVKYDANGNATDSGGPCLNAITTTQTDLTGTRFFGIAYQNTGPSAIYVSGYGTTSGSSTGQINCLNGPSSPSLMVWSNEATATVSSGTAGFSCLIPAGYFYEITVSGAISGPTKWFETAF